MRESTKDRLMREAAMEVCYPYHGGVEMLGEECQFPKENDMCSPCGERSPCGVETQPYDESTMREFAANEIEQLNRELDMASGSHYWFHKGWLAGIEHHKRVVAELNKRMD